MKDSDLIDSVTKLVEDREFFCASLGIANVHNAKQALAKLHHRVKELEGIVQEFVDATGCDNYGNALKKVCTVFGVQESRISWMLAAPHTWVGKVSSSRHETLLNALSRKVQQILSFSANETQKTKWEHSLILAFQTKDYQDFSHYLDTNLADLVHGEPTPAHVEEEKGQWINFADQLDTTFVTNFLSPAAVESLRVASVGSPGKHFSSERFSQMTEQEIAVPSRAGQTAATIARTLCAEAIFGEVPVFGTDEHVAFQGVVEDQYSFFSVLNEGGVDRVAELVGEALVAMEEEALATQ